MHSAGFDDPGQYRFDVHRDRSVLLASPERRKDLRAFEMAVARARRRASMTDVLRAGPLECPPDELRQYLRVYRSGLDEVSQFLHGQPCCT